jgi:hypothetical protein
VSQVNHHIQYGTDMGCRGDSLVEEVLGWGSRADYTALAAALMSINIIALTMNSLVKTHLDD